MRNKILAVAIAAAGVAFSGVAAAAPVQGTVGGTSTGSLVINATIPKLIRITGLADVTMTLPAVDPSNGYTANATGSSPACVRQNGANATYGIVATSANSAFELANGALAPVPYSLTWGGTALAYNTNLAAQVPDSTTLGSCAAVAGKLAVTIAPLDLNAAEGSASAYTDTVTLVVTPE